MQLFLVIPSFNLSLATLVILKMDTSCLLPVGVFLSCFFVLELFFSDHLSVNKLGYYKDFSVLFTINNPYKPCFKKCMSENCFVGTNVRLEF